MVILRFHTPFEIAIHWLFHNSVNNHFGNCRGMIAQLWGLILSAKLRYSLLNPAIKRFMSWRTSFAKKMQKTDVIQTPDMKATFTASVNHPK